MRVWIAALFAGALMAGAPARAGAADQPAVDQAALDEVVRLGTTSTLAPLCALRDEAWSFDLRRAALQRATRAERPDDDALRSAPGSALVQGALGYAEAEALEDFAGTAPATACAGLLSGRALREADGLVQEFRALKAARRPAS